MKAIINGLEINYVDIVDSANINEVTVILHGWGACIASVGPIVNSVKSKKRVIAIDLPGFGESSIPEKVMNSFDYAEVIISFLNSLNIQEFDLIGHSFGGKISAIIASKLTERVNKLVLVDAAGMRPKRSAKYYFRVYSYKFKKFIYNKLLRYIIPTEKLENILNNSGSEDYRNAIGIMRKILVTIVNEDISDICSKIVAPTLLIWGKNDDATPVYMADMYDSLLNDSGIVLLEGGHFSYLDDYSTFYSVINAFL